MAEPAFVLLHFNDAYHIDEEATSEPVGGAARFATLVRRVRASLSVPMRLTCGGDVFNPSLMSIGFKGKQMVPVLRALQVDYACVGNHDFDFGADVLVKLLAGTAPCKWLLTNVHDRTTGRPLVDALPYVHEVINGVRVAFFALIEPGWMQTLTCDTSAFDYTDYVRCGNETAAQLRNEGAEFVVCITHMREPEDIALCEGTTGIDLVLGGHDHFYACGTHNGVVLVKSGMDFRYATQISVYRENGRFRVEHEKHEVTSAIVPDEEVAGIVRHFKGQLEGQLGKVIGQCTTELDARASSLRTGETAIGNFVSDVVREEFGADVAIMNSGTIRSDNVYGPGPITMKTLLMMFPFEDLMVVVRVTGADILAGLENGVSKWPTHEGRFPQVSGVRFSFDADRPPGSRVLAVSVGEQPLELARSYSMVTKPYMLEGKDGYECFQGKEYIVDRENGQLLSLMLRNYFRKLHIAAALRHHVRKPEEIARDKFRLLAHKDSHAVSPAVISPVKDGRIIRITHDAAQESV